MWNSNLQFCLNFDYIYVEYWHLEWKSHSTSPFTISGVWWSCLGTIRSLGTLHSSESTWPITGLTEPHMVTTHTHFLYITLIKITHGSVICHILRSFLHVSRWHFKHTLSIPKYKIQYNILWLWEILSLYISFFFPFPFIMEYWNRLSFTNTLQSIHQIIENCNSHFFLSFPLVLLVNDLETFDVSFDRLYAWYITVLAKNSPLNRIWDSGMKVKVCFPFSSHPQCSAIRLHTKFHTFFYVKDAIEVIRRKDSICSEWNE